MFQSFMFFQIFLGWKNSCTDQTGFVDINFGMFSSNMGNQFWKKFFEKKKRKGKMKL